MEVFVVFFCLGEVDFLYYLVFVLVFLLLLWNYSKIEFYRCEKNLFCGVLVSVISGMFCIGWLLSVMCSVFIC